MFYYYMIGTEKGSSTSHGIKCYFMTLCHFLKILFCGILIYGISNLKTGTIII